MAHDSYESGSLGNPLGIRKFYWETLGSPRNLLGIPGNPLRLLARELGFYCILPLSGLQSLLLTDVIPVVQSITMNYAELVWNDNRNC